MKSKSKSKDGAKLHICIGIYPPPTSKLTRVNCLNINTFMLQGSTTLCQHVLLIISWNRQRPGWSGLLSRDYCLLGYYLRQKQGQIVKKGRNQGLCVCTLMPGGS
jgi:hypothetical protein